MQSMSVESIQRYIDTNYQYLVCEDQSKIMAVIAIRDNSHLFHLFVSDTYQGKGLAKRLWLLAANNSITQGNTGYFTVNSALNAQKIYLKLGFTPVSEVRIRKGIKDIPMEIYLEPD
ncbi:Acetyltransferase (GNAT) domain-containing protein [Pseudoalteromonas denitrificans DSM 6059]|uniref:Acetyltransferase (GNAT) domain-containing protein n=2 Tax=Pseudoalteromonas TaxID=53246 RepID=A0A1I1G4E9_9GAMM|nr:Acetyltransferase (GNAT) domain-containing protein [Pseudoalteromonas denitrificans DSM 6059]